MKESFVQWHKLEWETMHCMTPRTTAEDSFDRNTYLLYSKLLPYFEASYSELEKMLSHVSRRE